MTRQLEARREQKQERHDKAIIVAVEYGLFEAVGHAGGVLTGFAVRLGDEDCLMTLRAVVAGSAQIAFIGSDSLGNCLVKAVREAEADRLSWRADKYADG